MHFLVAKEEFKIDSENAKVYGERSKPNDYTTIDRIPPIIEERNLKGIGGCIFIFYSYLFYY